MRPLKASNLQRDYGLSFKAAGLIIHAQTTQARKHYFIWFGLAGLSLTALLIAAFVLPRPISHNIFHLLLPVAGLFTATAEWLAQRRARPAIIAAARAASTSSQPA